MPVMYSTFTSTCQPSALSATSCRVRCTSRRKPTQRCLLTTSQAAAQQTDVKTQLSQEQTQKALQYQIDRSTKQAPPATQQQEQPFKEYEKELVKRQKSAREWITPWLTVKARSKSVNTMTTLRTDDSGLSKQQQDMALKRLLGQSWQVAAAHPVAVDEGDDDELDEELPSLQG